MGGWRPPDSGADKYWRRAVLLAPLATLYSLLPPLLLRVQKFEVGLSMFWDFGSFTKALRGSCSQLLRQRHIL